MKIWQAALFGFFYGSMGWIAFFAIKMLPLSFPLPTLIAMAGILWMGLTPVIGLLVGIEWWYSLNRKEKE